MLVTIKKFHSSCSICIYKYTHTSIYMHNICTIYYICPREIAEHIWRGDLLTPELRGHMAVLSDDFVRGMCMCNAMGGGGVDEAFSSGQAFARVLQRCLVLCLHMYVAYKIHSLPQYSHLLTTPEFPVEESDSEPEDDDDDYLSVTEEEEEAKAAALEAEAAAAAAAAIAAAAAQKKREAAELLYGKAEAEAVEEGPDPVLALKEQRQKRNRFYGSKVSFLFVKQQK
jgi:hypothetical protein